MDKSKHEFGGGTVEYFTNDQDSLTDATSKTLVGLEVGKVYLLMVFNYTSSTTYNYNRYDTVQCSGGTLQKITNLLAANGQRVAATFFDFIPTQTTATLTFSANIQFHLFAWK